jgi:hypothetical protein
MKWFVIDTWVTISRAREMEPGNFRRQKLPETLLAFSGVDSREKIQDTLCLGITRTAVFLQPLEELQFFKDVAILFL